MVRPERVAAEVGRDGGGADSLLRLARFLSSQGGSQDAVLTTTTH